MDRKQKEKYAYVILWRIIGNNLVVSITPSNIKQNHIELNTMFIYPSLVFLNTWEHLYVYLYAT